MEEWPEWLLKILVSNNEMSVTNASSSSSVKDVDDLIHNFLIIMLEHSMREKDGWKDIEATLHCAEWISMVGGSSTGEQRAKREKLLPVFKRRLMGDLLDFIARELRTQVLAAASAGVASYGLPLEVSKAEVENVALLSEALVENAVVILMLVEDHLRLQSKLFSSTRNQTASASPISSVLNATMSPSARGDSSNDSAIPFDYEKAPEGSDRKTEARKKFAEAMSHRMHLDSSIELIGKVLFGMEKGSTVMKTV